MKLQMTITESNEAVTKKIVEKENVKQIPNGKSTLEDGDNQVALPMVTD